MSATARYLEQNFLAGEAFAEKARIAPVELDALVAKGLVPSPSYEVIGDRLISVAFGELPCTGAAPGAYFHPEMIRWVGDARRVADVLDPGPALEALKAEFMQEAAQAVEALNQGGLIPAFEGDLDRTDAAGAMLNDWWRAHLAGIFGICVRRPGSLFEIARKEMLQSALSRLTDNGARVVWTASEVQVLRPLVDHYADACALFAPVEYPLSSRKRYVEDVPARFAPFESDGG